jgi:hypothetical protein
VRHTRVLLSDSNRDKRDKRDKKGEEGRRREKKG